MENILQSQLKKKLKMVIILSDFGGACMQQVVKKCCFLATAALIVCEKLQKCCSHATLGFEKQRNFGGLRACVAYGKHP